MRCACISFLLHLMVFGTVIENPHAHFFPVGCGKFFDACVVEFRADTLFRVDTDLVSFLLHHFTPVTVCPKS